MRTPGAGLALFDPHAMLDHALYMASIFGNDQTCALGVVVEGDFRCGHDVYRDRGRR